MTIRDLSQSVFLVTGGIALLCIPGILLTGSMTQATLQVIQTLAIIQCLPASLLFLWSARRDAVFGRDRRLAVVVSFLCGLWISFLIYFIVAADFGDF